MSEPNEAQEALGKMAHHAMKLTLSPELPDWSSLTDEAREKFIYMAQTMYAISAVGLPEFLDVEPGDDEPDQDVDPEMQFPEPMVLRDVFHEVRSVADIRAEVVGLLSEDADDGFIVVKLSMEADAQEELPDELRNALARAGMHLDGGGKLCRGCFDIEREEFIRDTIRVFDDAVQVVRLGPNFVGMPSSRAN
jgi:hypothetical protein